MKSLFLLADPSIAVAVEKLSYFRSLAHLAHGNFFPSLIKVIWGINAGQANIKKEEL